MRQSRLEARYAYLFISPFFVLFIIFGLFPLVSTVFMSFFKWDILGSHVFRGIDNYAMLLTDPSFYKAMANTFLIWFFTTIPQLLICLLLAVLLNAEYIAGRNLFRLAIFMPNITSLG